MQSKATRGSQRWLQELVESNSRRLESAIGLGELKWLSPLATDAWAEYRDAAFLERLGVELTERPLNTFWPSGGPVWDGLALAHSGASVLVEAKAHIPEMVSTCAATASASVSTIRAAFDETKAALGVDSCRDWCAGYYQYANRLAHAYLMNELNGVPTELVFVYFVGDSDMAGPVSRREWEFALVAAHDALGVVGRLPRYVHDAFVDVSAE